MRDKSCKNCKYGQWDDPSLEACAECVQYNNWVRVLSFPKPIKTTIEEYN